MATFIRHSLKPKGRYAIKMRRYRMPQKFRGLLMLLKTAGHRAGRHRRRPVLMKVNCLGCSVLAPVMVINDVYYTKVTPERK